MKERCDKTNNFKKIKHAKVLMEVMTPLYEQKVGVEGKPEILHSKVYQIYYIRKFKLLRRKSKRKPSRGCWIQITTVTILLMRSGGHIQLGF